MFLYDSHYFPKSSQRFPQPPFVQNYQDPDDNAKSITPSWSVLRLCIETGSELIAASCGSTMYNSELEQEKGGSNLQIGRGEPLNRLNQGFSIRAV